ncbi:hypothetical protein LC087_03725 [Bacillus carboniphilus]|uniref:Lipoprotein n=1 Tax=Bacillus carboniphilus TaxID=86663 RepID=A0ABY9JV74_9BACI|nr:DUF6612 family protein [Bacillus carboniphilus]WLR43309.1 hypothetical protein LC087_03725 [Bacillus carboniphilus]
MKNLRGLIIVFALLLTVSACGLGNSSDTGSTNEKKENQEELTKQEVIDNIMQTEVTDISSVVEGETTIESNGQNMTTSIDIKMDMTNDPYAIHMNMGSIDGEIELYMDKNYSYVLIPGEEEWVSGHTDAVIDPSELQIAESFKQYNQLLKDYSDLFDMSYENGMYRLTLNNSNLNDERLVQFFEKSSEMNNMSISVSKINSIDYSLYYDDQFFLTKVTSNINSDQIVEDGSNMTMNAKLEIKSKVNKGTKITIPTEVVENAIPVE